MQEQNSWIRWLPGVLTLRQYQPNWLPRDIVAGVVLATMLVPVGIVYAVASGVPGIYGLYATIVPLLAYALFGPRRILVLRPDSSHRFLRRRMWRVCAVRLFVGAAVSRVALAPVKQGLEYRAQLFALLGQ